MVVRPFLLYVLVEMAVVVALGWYIGVGWTLLVLVASFLLGLALAGSQIKRQVQRLRAGMSTPEGAISDGALVALGTVLVVIPGLVSSAAGALLLLPPTRKVARPMVTFIALRSFNRRVPLITAATVGAQQYAHQHRSRQRSYIDGEVIDVTDWEPPALPRSPEPRNPEPRSPEP